MRATAFLLQFLIACIAFSQISPDILIYHDVYEVYGDAVITAATNLWPSAYIEAYTGYPGDEQAAFNQALINRGYGWDIVVVESWMANSNSLDWYSLQSFYENQAFRLFVSTWQWGEVGQSNLGWSMGAYAFVPVSNSDTLHYCWESYHPIAVGISDWNWIDLGLGIPNSRLTVSGATSVTGWTPEQAAGQAGICVSDDGNSVISGFTPAYAVENVEIWESILWFLGPQLPLERSSWAEIKASFH